jgi:hypothetical protein
MGGVEQVRGPKKQISRQMHMFQPKGLYTIQNFYFLDLIWLSIHSLFQFLVV